MNLVVLHGNLGKDPEKRTTKAGKSVTSFSLAINDKYKDANGETRERTEWVNVVTWEGLADNCAKYLVKGSSCIVEGELRTRSYEKNGEKRYVTEVIAKQVRFTGGRPRSGDDGVPAADDEMPF